MTGISYDPERLREIGERYGVARLDVFGSASRGDGHSESDIDLLYEFKPGTRLGFAFFALEDELTELFGRPVDLVARDSVNEYIRPQVVLDARPLYAA
ncbi:nucleotidyltransferase family protein [uncultured Microbacterium sp.]|uniref:nucleotidyltransferase family protein n=1 Tax=uncultured Microbacterium sp. TaxID=191216 RepID=UPI0025D66D65|nr:nucleotidyltransferase family protein [uncultured Microbacterium sp.]